MPVPLGAAGGRFSTWLVVPDGGGAVVFDRDWPPPHAEMTAAKLINRVDLIAPVTLYKCAKGIPGTHF